MTRTFQIEFIGHATLTVEDSIIDVVDDDWRAVLYDLNTPEEIAEHLAFNLLQRRTLSMLDGWADQPNENARITGWDEDVNITATEVQA